MYFDNLLQWFSWQILTKYILNYLECKYSPISQFTVYSFSFKYREKRSKYIKQICSFGPLVWPYVSRNIGSLVTSKCCPGLSHWGKMKTFSERLASAEFGERSVPSCLKPTSRERCSAVDKEVWLLIRTAHVVLDMLYLQAFLWSVISFHSHWRPIIWTEILML